MVTIMASFRLYVVDNMLPFSWLELKRYIEACLTWNPMVRKFELWQNYD